MGQVPDLNFSRFLIVGGGRAGRHLAAYLHLENLPYAQWTRSDGERCLAPLMEGVSHVVLAISDRAIEPFLLTHRPILHGKTVVHLSGALSTPLAASAHPLMTFGPDAYPLETYRSMHFALERGREGLERLLPGLSNPSFELDPADKPFYHAWCAMSGNFTALLWAAFFERLEDRLQVPRRAAFPYLRQQVANLEAFGARAVTGPLARGDRATVEGHLRALAGDSFLPVYEGFLAGASK